MLQFLATVSKQRSTLLPKTTTMSNEIALKFRPFDKVEHCFDIVAQNGNIVEATKQQSCLLLQQCCFDIIASVDRA